MNQRTKIKIHKFYIFLKEAMPVMIFLMLIFFGAAIIGFMKDNKVLLQDTKNIVAKQDETLKAIEELTKDIKIESNQKTDIIICMLQVPIAQRTADTITDCKNSVLPENQRQTTQQTSPTQEQPSQTQQSSQQVQPEQSSQSPEPSMIQRVGEGLTNISNSVENFVKGVFSWPDEPIL